MKRKLYLGRSAILGLRFGAFLLGIVAALALAYIGIHTYQARTGLPGGELTIAPAFALFFYVGWTAKEGSLRRRAAKRRAQKRPPPKRTAFTTPTIYQRLPPNVNQRSVSNEDQYPSYRKLPGHS